MQFIIAPVYAQNIPKRYNFNIEGGELGNVMKSIHDISGVQLLFLNDLVHLDGLNAIKGNYTLKEALDIVLRGTGLSSGLTERGMVVITHRDITSAETEEDNKMNQQSKNALLAGVTAAAVSISGQALGQENDTNNIETVMVTGIRSSLEKAVETKRRSSVITDVISSTDLGRFPDENVAESLQRVTGVQIERLRGEGSKVSIRGLPPAFTATTLNGRSLASAFTLTHLDTTSRSFEFSALPSEFVSSLEVYKTPMASLKEGGLAGTVIIRTPSPLDIGKRKIALSTQGAHESNSGEISPRISGLFSNVYADGTVGITLGAAYTERSAESHSSLSRGFRQRRQNTQNLLLLEKFEEEKERLSLIGRVEWEPIDNLRLFADGFYTELDNTSVRGQIAYNFGNTVGRIGDGTPEQFIESGTIRENIGGNLLTTRAELSNVEVRPGGRVQRREGDTTALSFGGAYETGNWELSGELDYSKSEQLADGLNVLTQGFISQAGYDARLDDDMTSLILSEAARAEVNNPDNYRFLSLFGEFGSEIDDEIMGGKFDAARELDLSFPSTLKFGISYSKQDQFGISRRLDTDQAQLAALLQLPDSAVFPGSFSAASLVELTGAGSGGYLDSYSGPAYTPDRFLRTRTRDIVSSFSRSELEAIGTVSVNGAATIDVTEKVLAAYGQFDFASSDERVSGNIGIRVVETDQTTRGITPDLDAITFQPQSGAFIEIPDGDPISVSRSYTDVLPSANIQIEVAEDWVTRVAISRTISRPELGQISPSTTASNVPPTINRNNPYLDPFRSNNFDTSLEWYFDSASILSATFFYKELVSLIENDSERQILSITEILADETRNQIDEEFIVNSVKNGEGVNLQGVELTFQHSFSNLPGLFANTGTLLNYTYIDNSDPEKVAGASSNNFNASGYYEGDKLSVRLSYTWRDKYLLSANAQEGFGRFIKPSGVLDMNITYDVMDNVSFVLEAINVLDEPISSVDGNDYPAIFEDNGRRILFGVKANF